jgi:hypothetical protein
MKAVNADASITQSAWPVLPALDDWRDTFDTVHMWAQIVGKVRLALAPRINHSWGSALYLTTRGLGTSPIPHGARSFAVEFDLLDHALRISTSDGAARSFALIPMTVADFHSRTMNALRELGIEVRIFTRPVEVVDAIRFEQDDRHRSYDANAVQLFWRAAIQAERVFSRFRAGFVGKASPVHFFWGAFDLAVTRFSGRSAPKHRGGVPNCADWVMVDAYSHEVSSAGFWPGSGIGEKEQAAFYSYAYPEPQGFSAYPVLPGAAYFHKGLGEFVLPYEAVRTANDPDRALLSFLESTYAAAADRGAWERATLERRTES